MPPVFGTAIAVVATLVILRSRERQDVLAADDRDEARFFAAQEFFDHHRVAGRAELTREHRLRGS